VTRYAYDSLGNLATITNAVGSVTTLAYDGVGRLVGVTDPKGSTGSAQYDAAGRLVRITDPLGNPTAFAYDAVGQLVRAVDAKGQASGYAYDSNGNLTEVTDALGHITRYVYDAVNSRTGFTDANNHATSYAFDPLNRLVTVTDPLGNVNRYEYDRNGNVVAATDANGATSRFEHDAAGRLVRITYADGAVVSYQYDANGNRVAMDDARGRTTYEYDALDRPIRIVHPQGAVGYAYDAVGNRSALMYPDGKVVRYAYDAVNRLQRVTDWSGKATTYTYDAAGNLTGVKYPNGVAGVYQYDRGNRLTSLAYAKSVLIIDSLTYTLDELGNRVSVTRKNPVVGLPYSTERYAYDALSQLVQIEKVHAGLPVLRTVNAYDAVGNRLSQSKTGQGVDGPQSNELTNFTYDAANRLLQAGDLAFAYDSNGNRISEEQANGRRRAYAYDRANRLTSLVESGSGLPAGRVSRYTYDGDGNKVGQTATESAGNANFLLDVAAGLPVTLREAWAGKESAYIYGNGLLSMDKRPDIGALGSHYYHPDGLGSSVALTGTLGVPRAFYRYDAWGNVERKVETVPNRFRFTGEEEDPVTGLYYLRARWYDPRMGVFLRKDPFAGHSGDPSSLNRYAYVSNNPLNLRDPSGLLSLGDLPLRVMRHLGDALESVSTEVALDASMGAILQGAKTYMQTRDAGLILSGAYGGALGTTRGANIVPSIKNGIAEFAASQLIRVVVSRGGTVTVRNDPVFSRIPVLGLFFGNAIVAGETIDEYGNVFDAEGNALSGHPNVPVVVYQGATGRQAAGGGGGGSWK
jgi:RHS repeat-associated protein